MKSFSEVAIQALATALGYPAYVQAFTEENIKNEISIPWYKRIFTGRRYYTTTVFKPVGEIYEVGYSIVDGEIIFNEVTLDVGKEEVVKIRITGKDNAVYTECPLIPSPMSGKFLVTPRVAITEGR